LFGVHVGFDERRFASVVADLPDDGFTGADTPASDDDGVAGTG
jgi:hypothetical protein